MRRDEQVVIFQNDVGNSAREFENDDCLQQHDCASSETNQQYSYDELNRQLHEHEYAPLIPTQSLVTYKRRWLMLFIFSLNTMMNGILFISLSPINNIMVRYYRVPSVRVEWLSNMFLLAYVVLALPASYLISKWGVRPIIKIASCLDFVATALRFLGCHQARFMLVLLGQGFSAVAYCMILQIPGKLSSQWFPEKESATATSIGVFMNLLGVSVGFLQPTLMVADSTDMHVVFKGLKFFFVSQMVLSAIILVLTMAYKERPPTPPTLNSIRESSDFTSSLKSLFHNKYYLILSQSYGIYFGVFVTFSVLANPLIIFEFPSGHESSLGWMGFLSLVAAILSCLVIGVLLDKYRAHRIIAIFLNASSLLVWLAFILVLTNTHQFYVLFVLYVLLGVFGAPYYASGIEQAAEMTYPVSEETSSTIILILGNLYGFLFILTLGAAAQNGYVQLVGYTMVGLYVLSTVLAVFAKTELKRWNAERQAHLRMSRRDTTLSVSEM